MKTSETFSVSSVSSSLPPLPLLLSQFLWNFPLLIRTFLPFAMVEKTVREEYRTGWKWMFWAGITGLAVIPVVFIFFWGVPIAMVVSMIFMLLGAYQVSRATGDMLSFYLLLGGACLLLLMLLLIIGWLVYSGFQISLSIFRFSPGENPSSENFLLESAFPQILQGILRIATLLIPAAILWGGGILRMGRREDSLLLKIGGILTISVILAPLGHFVTLLGLIAEGNEKSGSDPELF